MSDYCYFQLLSGSCILITELIGTELTMGQCIDWACEYKEVNITLHSHIADTVAIKDQSTMSAIDNNSIL